ncbi:unnamed protein product [Closterium sp. NIES-65]|nr:unnamed protein product [Closterium sp. NIES-65]
MFIVAGALVAAVRDFSFEAYGYSIAPLANLATALYLSSSPPYPQCSVAVIVAGALVAAVRDFSFEAYGYSVVLLSNLTTALYLTLIARLGKSTGLNSFGLMWSNGINCIPALLLWTFVSGEIQRALAFPALLDPAFLVVLSMSCLMAFALNYTVFLNTSLNSALTQNMCGNLKDLGTVGIGWALFGGLPFDVVSGRQG